ncbi:MAG: ABC transporter ATP-binding protein [Pseudomonadota bacterium]|jgi:ABC-2 type transport system ATP-binding protein
MIELQNVCKSYGDFRAVDRLSLSVPDGSICAFLGMNGAGKTTTIKMMTGILPPTSGSIIIGGYDIRTEACQAKSLIGYVPDRPHLYPKLTGREYLYCICDLYRVEAAYVDQRIDALLDEYSLTPWQNTLIENYSHGMKQRIALCGALIHEPRVLIVDEPMVGLDPHGARDLKSAFKRYAKRGVTVFISTHSLNVAEELADYIAIIHKGQLLTTGTLDQIKELTNSHSLDLEQIFLELTTQQIEH